MTKPSDSTGGKAVLKLADADAGVDLSSLAVFTLNHEGNVLNAAPVNDQGQFDIPADALSSAARVVVAPAPRGSEGPDLERAVPFSLRDFAERLKSDAVIEIDKSRWVRLFPIRRCVDGSIEHCYPFPHVVLELEQRAVAGLQGTTLKARARLEDLARITPDFPIFPRLCKPLCDGEVEVYKRVCCCRPYIFRDPRIFEIIRDLERIVETIPIGPIDPRPGPDPGPLQRLATRATPLIHESGALDEAAVNAATDLQALRTLAPVEQLVYLDARPHLRCWRRCGIASSVGRGFLQPDGTFHICWGEPLSIFRPFCRDEFAFKVTQVVGGVATVIYDGVATNQWFNDPHGVELVTYNRRAQSCDHGLPIPVDGAAALLLDIGLTDAWHLKTPDADGPLSVATPADFNDGLLHPGPVANRSLNLNLGGTLSLLYGFTEPLRGVAKYYRVSVCPANASGNPTGTRQYFDDHLSWYYLVLTPTGLAIQTQFLGPQPVGASTGLYLIPYRADREYKSNQFHAYIDTASFPPGRYLLTLEVFDDAGHRLHPAATPAVDPADVAGAFTFNRWFQETGPTAVVPFGALTHMLWWDNREVTADIVELQQNGVGSDAECQFLSGPPTAQFSMTFRAYHPEPLFLQGYSSYWRRGLGGGSDSLGSGGTNAGQPPAAAAISTAVSFEDMLTPADRKCAFSVNLDVSSKTTNGFGRLGIDAHDQVAFAVEIV